MLPCFGFLRSFARVLWPLVPVGSSCHGKLIPTCVIEVSRCCAWFSLSRTRTMTTMLVFKEAPSLSKCQSTRMLGK
ncbi:hypothetical protein IF2G_04591 [Cordyceps javanica]|nr:hypothetical protein IF2G_04591 [Cordyceps javanica]